MSERKINFNDLVEEYLEEKIKKHQYNQQTVETLASSVLENFRHVIKPTGYYISIIKPKIKKFGNKNENIIIVDLNSFLFSVAEINVKYYRDNTKYTKERILDKINQLCSQLNEFSKEEYKLPEAELNGISEKVIKLYYSAPTLKIK